LFDPARKRPLPFLPGSIGLVTSPTGAAVRDILKVLGERFPAVPVLLCPVRVQGAGAAAEIAAALAYLGSRADLDVLVVARGGGSLEDLWAFNEEVVARAIAASPIPVISAVGHETDVTIADFVADLRAPTPSAAAELVVARRDELRQRVDDLTARGLAALQHALAVRRSRAEMLERHLFLLSPVVRLARQADRLRELRRRLGAWWTLFRTIRGERLARAAARLESLSPLAILGRGYSICFTLPERRVLKTAAEAAPGSAVAVRLHQGELHCVVRSGHSTEEQA
jgi:exodeoxyribonuclease VII large subunit